MINQARRRGCTVRELLNRWTAREELEEEIFDLCGFDDLQGLAGAIAASVYNAQPIARARPVLPADIFPPAIPPPEDPGQSDEEIAAALSSAAALFPSDI